MPRLRSIDVLRGAIMLLMVIDHVRVYAGVPAGGAEPALFFTRWVTHFCAPGFAFLAGTAIFFHAKKLENKNKISRFLLIRGLLLVLLEATLIRFSWTFNLNFSDFFLAGVIWMLGCCMILMSLLVRLQPLAVGFIGIIIMASQQVFKFVPELLTVSFQPAFSVFWNFVYPTGTEGIEGVFILYVIVPWLGVMAAGYGFGLILIWDPVKRNKFCLAIGLSFMSTFIIAGTLFVLNSPPPEEPAAFIFRLLNQNKYPASQLFLLMTLGPIITMVPLAEKASGWLIKVLSTFGKSPLFYYLLHIPLIHISALIVNYIRTGASHQEWYKRAPFWTVQPEGVRWSLGLLYLLVLINLFFLYFSCKWYAGYKAAHPGQKWLRYI